MSDETTVNSAINGRTILRATVSGGKTYIIDAITNRIVFYIDGVIGGGVEVMTTEERLATTPAEGELIYDSELEALYVGDGVTAGGVAVASGAGTPTLESDVTGNTATITLDNGAGQVELVGTGNVELKGNTNGQVEINVTGGSGAVTGIEASVSGNTATITATGSTTSVKLTGTGGVEVRGNTTTGAVELDAKDLSDGTQSVSKDLKEARYVESNPYASNTAQNALTLLHFSDIHSDPAALARIYAKGLALAPNIDDMICTGDYVNKATSIESWWNPAIMTVIGNHDCADDSYDWTALSMANRVAYYIAPFEANWGITRGEGVDYYYKDYATQKVRLITLDCQLYNWNPSGTTAAEASAQSTWLSNLLDDAITQGLHVVIAVHAPYRLCVPVQCSFSKYQMQPQEATATQLPLSVVEIVAAKIAAGLHFVCYICGHLHQDGVWDATGDGTQYMISITCACVSIVNNWKLFSDQFRDDTLDAFNLITIDTINSRLKVVRGGGANFDCRMRKREELSINYSTGEIIDYEVQSHWVVIQDIGTASTAEKPFILTPGHPYRHTDTGAVYLTVRPPRLNHNGADSSLELFVSNPKNVHALEPLVMLDDLVTDAVNHCVVEFFDGYAYLTVKDQRYGYTVTVTGGSTGADKSGSLIYGLTGSTINYIGFANNIDGETIDLGGVATSNGVKHIVGNGYEKTILTGGVSCTSTTTFTNLSLVNASCLAGTMTLSDVYIPNGATVTTLNKNGAAFNIKKASGSGVIDGNSGLLFLSNCNASGLTFTGCLNSNTTNRGGLEFLNNSYLYGCVISGNSATQANGAALCIQSSGSIVTFESCTIANNAGGSSFYLRPNTTLVLSDCIISQAIVDHNAVIKLAGSNAITSGGIAVMYNTASYGGTMTISAGAVIDLTGNTRATTINPGKGIIVADGDSTKSCTVLVGATVGVVDSSVAIVGGTYATIKNDGTTTA